MTSKKSYAKSPLFAVFRTQLYSQRMLLILFGVVLALVPLAVGVISLNPSDVTYSYDYGGINHYIAAQRQLMTVCGLIPLLCFALALAVGEFGYLNQRRKLDFYHAIPVRRSDMFLGRALLASVSLVLGVLLVVLGQILIVNVQFVTISVGGGRLEQVYAAIWKNGVFMVFSVLAAYFFAVLVVVAAKSLWEAAFSLLLLSAAYPLSAMITIRIVQSSMMFYRLSDDPVMLTLFSPFATGFVALFSSAWTALPVWVLPVLLLQAAVCGVLGVWAFCRRPSERAESGASKGFRWAVRFCASAAGAFVGSYGLLYFLDAYPAFLFGSVLGAAAAWVALELLYAHSLRGLLKTLSAGAAGFAAFAAVNVLIAFGLIGGMTLPTIDQVDAVALHGQMGSYRDTQRVFPRLSGYLNFSDENGSHNVQTASFDTETVEETYALLEDMMAYQREAYFPYHPSERARVYERCWFSTDTSCSVSVALYMAGTERRFTLEDLANERTEAICRRAEEIACTPQYVENDPNLARFDALERIEGVADGQRVQAVPTDAEIERLREAYEMDALTVTDSSADTDDPEEELYLYFDEEKEITLLGGIVDSHYPGEGRKGTLALEGYKENSAFVITPSTYPNTAAVVEKICAAHG